MIKTKEERLKAGNNNNNKIKLNKTQRKTGWH